MNDTVELKFTVTPAEAKTLLDALMSMRLHPTEPFVDAVNYSAPPPPFVGNSPAPAVMSQAQGATANVPPPPFVGNSPAQAQAPAFQPGGSNNPPPPPPPVGNVPPAAAPAAAPSAPAQGATVSPGPTDKRGVPFHIEHHSGTAEQPGFNDDGSFKKRRGHDKDKLKAYEAQYLGKSNGHAAQGVVTHPASGTAPSTTAVSGGANVPPPPPPPAPPAGTPGIQDFELLWGKLVANGQATPALENWIDATFGGHPVHSDVFKVDPEKRHQAYNFLKRYDVVVPAAA